ncbi:unnamed protein product [Candida parapsilosis]
MFGETAAQAKGNTSFSAGIVS